MATALADKALDAVSEAVIDKLKNDLTGERYGDATQWVDEILNAIQTAKQQIQDSVTRSVEQRAYDDAIVHLETWTKVYKDGLDDKANGKNDKLDNLRKDLRNTSSGILYELTNMNGLLVGVSKQSDKALIRVYSEGFGNQLASDDMDKTIPWYLKQVDDYLVDQFKVQNVGLALQLWAADDKADMDRCQSEMKTTLEGQIENAYENFPSFIRKIKSSYAAPPNPSWWWKFKSPHNNHQLCIGEGQNDLTWEDGGDDHKAQFRFTGSAKDNVSKPPHYPAPLDQVGVVRIQNRDSWDLFIGAHLDTGGFITAWNAYGTRDEFWVKIAPQGQLGDPNCFLMIPQEEGPRSVWPYKDVWQLTDLGINDNTDKD